MTTTSRSDLWHGVLVAATTPFGADLAVDREAWQAHVRWLVDAGSAGIVVAGSLGEGSTLSPGEKLDLAKDAAATAGRRAPVIGAVAAARTADAVALARGFAEAGAQGLLVLPPYVYRGDVRETNEHFREVFRATELPCMLYNNPIAYGTDVLPEQVLELAEDEPTLAAVKESSGDVRRITALKALLGERVEVAVGLDDAILEGIAAGATGWVAGLANAFPEESVELFALARRGAAEPARELYRWFLPLLRLDTRPKFVQLIKQVQAESGRGSARVRPPRRELAGEELAGVRLLVAEAARTHPNVARAKSRGAGGH